MNRPPFIQYCLLVVVSICWSMGDLHAKSFTSLTCDAAFETEMISDFEVVLTDISGGEYDSLQWLVNGSVVAINEVVWTNVESVEGIYEVCLQIWATDGACFSESCQDIYFGDPENLCLYTDCVWPGDATGNSLANNYDVLNIGLGHGYSGLIRPDAHTNWIGQYAPNWGQATIQGVDYKHLDCNGDGLIDEQDLDAVIQNYTPEPVLINDPVPGAPEVWLEFDADSLVINDDSPDEVLVTAGIYVGTDDLPAQDLHGLALTVSFPQNGLLFLDSVFADYETGAFLGAEEDILWLSYLDLPADRIDLAISREGGIATGGSGRVATVGFIVVSDIIGGRSEIEIPLDIILKGIKMIDGEGNPLDYGLADSTSTLMVYNEFITASNTPDPTIEDFNVFPNPAKNYLYINVSEAKEGQLSVYNINGQRIWQGPFTGKTQIIDLHTWPSGMYNVYLQTQGNRYSQKVLIDQ